MDMNFFEWIPILLKLATKIIMAPNFYGQVLILLGLSIEFDFEEEFHFCFSLCWVLVHFHCSQAFFLVLDCSLNIFQELLIHLEVDWQSVMGDLIVSEKAIDLFLLEKALDSDPLEKVSDLN